MVIVEIGKTAQTVAVHAEEDVVTEVVLLTVMDLAVMDLAVMVRFRTERERLNQSGLPVSEQEQLGLVVVVMGHNLVDFEQIRVSGVYSNVCIDLKEVPLLATVPLMGQAVDAEHSLQEQDMSGMLLLILDHNRFEQGHYRLIEDGRTGMTEDYRYSSFR